MSGGLAFRSLLVWLGCCEALVNLLASLRRHACAWQGGGCRQPLPPRPPAGARSASLCVCKDRHCLVSAAEGSGRKVLVPSSVYPVPNSFLLEVFGAAPAAPVAARRLRRQLPAAASRLAQCSASRRSNIYIHSSSQCHGARGCPGAGAAALRIMWSCHRPTTHPPPYVTPHKSAPRPRCASCAAAASGLGQLPRCPEVQQSMAPACSLEVQRRAGQQPTLATRI